jgi:hypothetical protein
VSPNDRFFFGYHHPGKSEKSEYSRGNNPMKSLILTATALALLTAAPLAAQMSTTDVQGQPVDHGARQASNGEFGAIQISTTDPEKLMAAWRQPTPGIEIQTQNKAARGEVIHTFVIFSGCKVDATGNCHVTASFEVFDPTGKSYAEHEDAPIFDFPSAPPHNLMLGQSSLGIRIEPGEPLGQYRVVVHTIDRVAGLSVMTEDMLSIAEAPLVGGWTSIPNPGGNMEARAAARAAQSKIPRPKARIAKIERSEKQVVAGTNYRLILRLTDKSRWTVTMWHKLDGTWVATEVAELR